MEGEKSRKTYTFGGNNKNLLRALSDGAMVVFEYQALARRSAVR
jgi:hypothetical protein